MIKDLEDEIEDFDDDIIIQSQEDLALEKKKKETRELAQLMRKSMGKYEPIIITRDGLIKKTSELNKAEQTYEYMKCASDPIYFIETHLTVFDQTQGDGGKIVPFILFPFQKKLVKEYHNRLKRFHVANKYRQAGISTTTCAFIAWYIMFNENRTAILVANSLGSARDELMSDVIEFIESCEAWMKPKPTKKNTQVLKKYDNGSSIAALAAKGGLRGLTPTLLFWDETAWTEGSKKFWTAAYSSLGTGGSAIMVSTPNSYDPVYSDTFLNAKNKLNNFNPIELWWYNDPRYNNDLTWVRYRGRENEIIIKDDNFDDAKRIKLMDDGWDATSPWFEAQVRNANYDMKRIKQELLCSFLGSGDNFIAEECVKRIIDSEIKKPIREEYGDKQMWIWEDPIDGEEYLMVIDVSSGHSDDFSSINILKRREIIEDKIVNIRGVAKKVKQKTNILEQVAEYYGRITPQDVGRLALTYGKLYNYAYCIIDVTGGYGSETVSVIIEDGYENIHYAEVKHSATRERLAAYSKTSTKVLPDGTVVDVDLIPGFFIGSNRPNIMLDIQRAIHLEQVIIRSERLLTEIKTIVNKPGRIADHRRGFHDDSFMGVAIGIYVVNYDMSNFKNDTNKVKKMIEALSNMNNTAKLEEINKKQRELQQRRNPYGSNAWVMSGFGRR